MTPAELLDAVAASTGAAGFDVKRLTRGDYPLVVARTSQFRWKWFASRLHTFIYAAELPLSEATPAGLDAFLDEAGKYARSNKGGMPAGLQTGTAAVAVAVVSGTRAELDLWAKPHGSKFAGIVFPVLADVERGNVAHPARLIIGASYSKYLREMVQEHVTSHVKG